MEASTTPAAPPEPTAAEQPVPAPTPAPEPAAESAPEPSPERAGELVQRHEHEPSPGENATPAGMWRYAEWVHVGQGAETCAEREGACADPLHFHAWVRLPNPFQWPAIREKALAAKARRMRQFRDPECDASVILDGDIEDAKRDRESMIEEAIAKDHPREQMTALRELSEEEGFAQIAEDQRRLGALEDMDPEQRNSDEYDELRRHLTNYYDTIDRKTREHLQPIRDSLSNLTTDELAEVLRNQRIEREATHEFMREFSRWQFYFCTLRPTGDPKVTPTQRVFPNVEAIDIAAPEICEALEAAYGRLEAAASSGSVSGN